MLLQLTLIFYFIIQPHNAIKLQGEFEQTAGNDNITMVVTVDTETDMVDIIMTGPYGKWFGIGFGSSIMNNTYAIVVSDIEIIDGFIVKEYKLCKSLSGTMCNYGGNDLSPPHSGITYLTKLSEGYVDNRRTVTLQRNRIGDTENHYTFPSITTNIDIIWAFGYQSGTTFSYHGTAEENARGSSILSIGTLTPTTSPTPHPTTEQFMIFDKLEKECNFFNRNGPMATDTCMKSVDYGTSMMDSSLYECHADTNSVIAKSFWCNGENCVGTVDNCANKGLLDSAVYSTLEGYEANYYAKWNCIGRDDCDKLTVKYKCCFQNSCYGGETADRYQTTYMQNMCWSQATWGVVLHCNENDVLIIDHYKYANCTELISSEPYDKDLHVGVTGWEGQWCDEFSYVCSGVGRKYITLLFWYLCLCFISLAWFNLL